MALNNKLSIRPERITALQTTARNSKGRYVLYWMQQSQRVHCNHALEFALRQANRRGIPLLVLFVLTESYPEANWRHYAFMLEGLQEVRNQLTERGIAFQITKGDPVRSVLKVADKASDLICDRGYLRHQRQWRRAIAFAAPCPVIQLESDVLIPVEVASPKPEYAARTIRPRIERLIPEYLNGLGPSTLKRPDLDLARPADFNALASGLRIDREPGPVTGFLSGGRTSAIKRMKYFLTHRLPDYDRHRNQPHLDGSSMLSPYLHFGQISPLEIALAVYKADAPEGAKEAFLEELIVRRELAVNYVFHCQHYDQYDGLPHWARRTLSEHAHDRRETVYAKSGLESGDTHDPYWNAAMSEMKHTGYMHSYMRMYWGKKILQWSPNPRDAYELTLALNNKYFIDGRDPNSYAGVGWIYGLHDRPWKERTVFGKIRYMARSGLERKFDMPAYLAKIHARLESLAALST